MALKAYVDQHGIHVPDYPAVLEHILDAYRGIYGRDLYLEPDSQDGALCAVFARLLYDCYALAVSVYNAYSPATAQGVGLSSVVKTNGIRRRVATRSQVDLRLIGQNGTVITGGIVRDESGNRWLLPARVVIGTSGEVTVTARAEEIGDIRAVAGDIRAIVTCVRGWQSVSNPTAAIPGAPVETDADLRRRQAISTALPSLTVFDGTAGAVAQVAGVLRSRGYENDTSVEDEHGIPPHSIAFVVEGGEPEAIASAIAVKKTPGTGTYGDVSVEVADKHGSTNTIRFFRPTIIEVAAHNPGGQRHPCGRRGPVPCLSGARECSRHPMA